MADDAREFRLPDLGEGLTEAEIVSWKVKEGEEVELNQALVEVETEKALVEIPSPFAGVVEKLHGGEGDRVEVGSVLVTFRVAGGGAEQPKSSGRKEVLVGYGPEEGAGRRRRGPIGRRNGETVTEAPEPEEEPEPEPAKAAPAKPVPAQAAAGAANGTAARSGSALATPPVRKLARDMGLEIDQIAGTGPGGRVTREDVLAASQGAPAAPASPAAAAPRPAAAAAPAAPRPLRSVPAGAEEERIPVRSIRRVIAEKMVKSYTSIPHVTEWLTIDVTDLMALRADLNQAPEAQDNKISPLPLIAKSLTVALRFHPMLNASWDEATNEIVVKHVYHVGIATDTERGLLVPVVRNADQMSVFELAAEIRRLSAAARDGSIGPGDLTGSTMTITSIGSFGMESGTPIINYPESAILAPGVIQRRPWVVDGQIVARDIMTLACTFDHRIVDGAEAGRFLRRLGDLLEHPARLLGLM